MINLKRLFTCLVLAFILVSSSVLATDTDITPISAEAPIAVTETNTADTSIAKSLHQDLYIYDTDSYTLNDTVYGNIFASTTKFTTDPRNNGGIISGNLFIISNEVVIGSDVSYSNKPDNNGNYIVNAINSKSVINGNVYALSDSFTLEAGSEIHGDLYIASTTVNIEQDAVIDGNVFITANTVNFNGQVSGSAYITTDKLNMNYYSYITRDLYLNSQNATLSGVIYRNAFITINDKLTTTSYFRVDQNLFVDYASDFTFSGEVKGNAKINSKNLTFSTHSNEQPQTCIIKGNLNYATENQITVPDGIVSGEIKTDDYIEMTDAFSIEKAMFSFLILLAFVIVLVCLSRKFVAKTLESLPSITAKNILISFVIGFASLLAVITLFITLILSGFGIYLALFVIIGYLLVIGLSLPWLIHDIAKLIKLKPSIYVKVVLVTAIFYLITLIPVIGSPVLFITILIGTGRILLGLFGKKNKKK